MNAPLIISSAEKNKKEIFLTLLIFMDNKYKLLFKLVDNLNYLISEREISGKLLANELGLTEATVSRYRNGVNIPSVSNLIKFADYFNCSVDYLIGDEEENTKLTFKAHPPISERMAQLPKIFNLTAKVFCDEVNISETAFYDWKSGSKEPNIFSIIKIAKQFDRRVDFILGRES